MKKVMLYLPGIEKGGAARAMINLAEHLCADGYDVTLVTMTQKENEYPLDGRIKRISFENVIVEPSWNKLWFSIKEQLKKITFLYNAVRNSYPFLTILKKSRWLREVCERECPDILISFLAQSNFHAVLATRGLPVKSVISVRNVPEKEYAGALRHFMGKHVLPLADGCVFQTEEAMSWFPESLQKKSVVIYNVVKPEFFQVERKPVPHLIVTCGRLVPQKNHRMLIGAFENIAKKYPDARLRIYGSGLLENELQRLIDEKKLRDRVFLMGQTARVNEALSQAALFVLPSDHEGMPNALMEAMAAGVPCISTDCPCGGPRKLIETDEDGLLVPVNDMQKMEEAIDRVFSDPILLEKLGANAKKAALRFTPDEVYQNWKNYMLKVLE